MQRNIMQLIRRNYPIILAWLAYVVSVRLLKLLLSIGLVWSQRLFYLQPPSNAYLFIGFVVFIAAEYIGFSISIRWVAIPLSLIEKKLSKKPKNSLLLIDWLGFCYIFVLLCLPLLLINSFPGITINEIPLPLPVSEEVADLTATVWKIVASLFAYRSTVASYLNGVEKNNPGASEYEAAI